MLISSPNFDEARRIIEDNDNLILACSELKVSIIHRTQNGIDMNGHSFRPYSRDYALRKEQEFGSRNVNLTRTQQMLNSIVWSEIENGVVFHFSNREAMNKAYKNQVRLGRKFFGASEEDKNTIKEKLEEIISNRLGGL